VLSSNSYSKPSLAGQLYANSWRRHAFSPQLPDHDFRINDLMGAQPKRPVCRSLAQFCFAELIAVLALTGICSRYMTAFARTLALLFRESRDFEHLRQPGPYTRRMSAGDPTATRSRDAGHVRSHSTMYLHCEMENWTLFTRECYAAIDMDDSDNHVTDVAQQ
jgi:hypothetical protein